jgi:hypothetical protein
MWIADRQITNNSAETKEGDGVRWKHPYLRAIDFFYLAQTLRRSNVKRFFYEKGIIDCTTSIVLRHNVHSVPLHLIRRHWRNQARWCNPELRQCNLWNRCISNLPSPINKGPGSREEQLVHGCGTWSGHTTQSELLYIVQIGWSARCLEITRKTRYLVGTASHWLEESST